MSMTRRRGTSMEKGWGTRRLYARGRSGDRFGTFARVSGGHRIRLMPVEPSDNTKAGGGGKKGVDGGSSSSKSVFRRLLGLLRPWRGTILICIAMLLVGGVCEIFPA